MALSPDETRRYSRQIALRTIGIEGQRKLKQARVSIVGVGGLGCVSALQLASMGVGYIRLIDQDVVDLTNLQRQPLYDVSSIGHPKVEVAQSRLKSINPHIETEPLPLAVGPDTAEEAVKDVDVVIDGLDRLEPRYAVNEACLKSKTPYIFGGALETYGNASTIIPHETACLECIFGRQNDQGMPTCETVGVIPSILAIIASIQVSESLDLILGKEPALRNKLLFCNVGSSLDFEVFPVEGSPRCHLCAGSEEARRLEGVRITSLCGEQSYVISTGSVESLDMVSVAETLDSRFDVKIRSQLAVTFNYNDRVSISLMKTGSMLIKGAKNEQETSAIYEDLSRMIKMAR